MNLKYDESNLKSQESSNEVPQEVPREELTRKLLKRAADEIRELRSRVQIQGAQLAVMEKLAMIAGWKDAPQGYGPDIIWEIDRYVNPPRPLVVPVED